MSETTAERGTPGATSDGVTDTATAPIEPPHPESIDWHTPEGQTGYSWGELQQLASSLSESTLVPANFRRQPANIVLMAVTGQELGWGIATSMRFIQVIEGKPTVSPEGMLALIRRAGHSVKGSTTSTYAVIRGVRVDNGDDLEVTFTMEDAVRANLAGKNNWREYPDAMLWARALAKLARRLFPDVLLGCAYVPDEMGVETDRNGNWIETTGREGGGGGGQGQRDDDPPPPDWTALHWDKGIAQFDAAMRDTKRLMNQLGPDAQGKVRDEVGPPPPTSQYSMNLWAVRHEAVVRAAREAGIADAFKDTTPNLTALDADAPPNLATLIPDAEPPAAPAGEASGAGNPPAPHVDTTATVRTPAAPYVPNPDDDEADRAWVAEAMGTDDTTPLVLGDAAEPDVDDAGDDGID